MILAGVDVVVDHIRVKRMWLYVQTTLELDSDELAHVAQCERCLELFRICVLAEKQARGAEEIEDDMEDKSA